MTTSLGIGVNMACSCATVQSLLEVDTTAAAVAKTIGESGGQFDWLDAPNPGTGRAFNGADLVYAPPILVVLDEPGEPVGLDAPQAMHFSGLIALRLIVPQPAAAAYVGSNLSDYWRAKLDAIVGELSAQIGGTGDVFSLATVAKRRPYTEDSRTGSFVNAQVLPVDINWE